jgi:ketosteroid isomerase-like protein
MADRYAATAIVASGAVGETGEVDGVELVREILDAFNRRDVAAIFERVEPDTTFVSMTGRLVREGEPYVGREGLERYLADVDRLWGGLRVEAREIQSAGNSVVVIGYVHARTDTGETRLPVVWTWRLRSGRVYECVVHSDERAARRAAGMGDH